LNCSDFVTEHQTSKLALLKRSYASLTVEL